MFDNANVRRSTFESLVGRSAIMCAAFLIYFLPIITLRLFKPSFYSYNNTNKIALLALLLACIVTTGAVLSLDGLTETALNVASIALFTYLAKFYFNLPLNLLIPLAVALAINSIFKVTSLSSKTDYMAPTVLNFSFSAIAFKYISYSILSFTAPALINYILFPNLSYGTTFGFLFLTTFVFSIPFLIASLISCFSVSSLALLKKGTDNAPSAISAPFLGLQVSRDFTHHEKTKVESSCCGITLNND